MTWSKLALFASGVFFGGAMDHAIRAAMGAETTSYGVRAGVRGNWLLADLDLCVAAAIYAWHQQLTESEPNDGPGRSRARLPAW